MMILPTLKKAFVLLSCTFLGLICGTLYLYSSYSPQFASRLNYSVSDASKIAQLGTIGVAVSGPISGRVVDKKGYTWALIIGGMCILCGYSGMKKQFDLGYSSLKTSYFLLYLIGSGSTFINSVCLKCCAVSFPSIRGVATSLPLALYGLSALFYSVIGSIFFPGDTSKFLGFLAYSSLVIFGICAPSIIITDREHRLRKQNRVNNAVNIEMSSLRPSSSITVTPQLSPKPTINSTPNTPGSSNNTSNNKKVIGDDDDDDDDMSVIHTGNIFYSPKFWILFFLTGFLAAIGQMYIYSVGYIVKALIGKGINFDNTMTQTTKAQLEAAIQKNQQLQVGLLSTTNCIGRLLSGIFGDIITQSFNKRRSWLLFIPSIGLTITQIMGSQIIDYNKLASMSLLTGFFYGFTFCIMPIIVGDIFGMENFSLNWGVVCLAPILPSFYFTNLFGNIFDSKSIVSQDGSHVCSIGKSCYDSVFSFTVVITSICIGVVCLLNFGYRWLSRREKHSQSNRFIN